MLRLILAAAMIVAPTVAVASPSNPAGHKRIIVDNTGECGSYRYAMHRRQDNERTARKLATSLEAAGYTVDVVVINPGTVIGAANIQTGNTAPIINISC